ncbi:MAG: hypothetical protein DRN08_00050 [Thermoplasmata archaeon]|nr:MAG: hypothetical protein DRN05_03325 [Thermoplasmata archaeon]RLF37153.1 MAG: hypothetical protein DRN08_00050 [Thermoplasmata archaeon]
MRVFSVASMFFILYFAVLILIGFYTHTKARTAPGFFLANRKLGTLLCTSTITATVVGGSATIVTGALVYMYGLPGLWIDIGGALGLIILGFFLANKVRKTGLYTLPEITGYLFDTRVRFAAAVLVIITEIAWVSLLLQSTCIILSVFIPLGFEVLLIVVTTVFVVYTLLGGQYAVVYTDFIQLIIMIVGICLIAAPMLFIKAFPYLSSMPSDHLSFPVSHGLGFSAVLSFFFMMIMPHVVGPDIYSKILSAKNEIVARRSSILSGVVKLVFAAAIGVIALCAVVLYPDIDDTSLVIPAAVSNLNPVLAVFVLASFVSVMISSADSCLLSAGTILSVDIARKSNIWFSRAGILAVGFASLLLSLYMHDIVSTLKLAYTVFTAGLTLPIIFGFYRRKTGVSCRGAYWSLILGGLISIVWIYIGSPVVDAVLVGLMFSAIPLIVFKEKKWGGTWVDEYEKAVA